MPEDPTQDVVTCIAAHDNQVFVGMANYQVIIYDLSLRRTIHRLYQDFWEVKALEVDSNFLFVGTLGETISVYNLKTFEEIHILKHRLGSIAIAIDDNFLYSGSYNADIRIWEKSGFAQTISIENHLIRTSAIHVETRYLLAGDGFKTKGAAIHVYSKGNFVKIVSVKEPISKRVLDIKTDEKYIYSAHGSPGELRIWNKSTFALVIILKDDHGDINAVTLSEEFIFYVASNKIFKWSKSAFSLLAIYNNTQETRTILYSNGLIFVGAGNRVKALSPKEFEEEFDIPST